MQISVGIDERHYDALAKAQRNLERAVAMLDQANELQRQANEINLQAKRLLLENARLMRALSGSAALHIADDNDGGTETSG